MSARHHAYQRKEAAKGDAGEQPAAAHGGRAKPAKSHDERRGGDVAADEGAILRALVGGNEGWCELLAAAKLRDIHRPCAA